MEKPIKELNVDAKPKTKSKKPASSTPKMSTKPRSSPPRGAAYTYTLTPRFQYLMIPQTRGNDESFDAPFFGLTAGVTPPGKKDFDIQASIFYGQADSRSDVGLSTLTNADAEYFDTEILLRQYINESNAYVAFGGRYLHIETDDTLANSGLTFASSGANNLKTETDTYLGEIGVGYSSAITENSVHQLFGQFVLGLGYASEENNKLQSDDNASGFATLFDLNLGYQYAVSDTMSAHARYRAILLSDENIFNGTIAHGPEIGVTYKF